MKKIRIALIYGGTSGEHAISRVTAGGVMRALDPERYEILSIGIRPDGTWVPGETDPSAMGMERGLAEVLSQIAGLFPPRRQRQATAP